MNAVDILKYGQLTVLRAIDDFPESAWETPGACGVWSVKEIIAHLASVEQVLVDVLTTFLGGGPTPYLTKFTEQSDQFNDTEVALRKEKPMREVLGELNETHTHVMSLVAQLPRETLREVGTLPWYGREYALDDFLVYTYYGHKREHSAQIAAFRDHLRRSPVSESGSTVLHHRAADPLRLNRAPASVRLAPLQSLQKSLLYRRTIQFIWMSRLYNEI